MMCVFYRRTGTFCYKRTGRFVFWHIFYDALVQFLSTAPGGFSVGVVFYNALAWTSCEAPVLYYIMTHRDCVYRVHGVWCANDFLGAPGRVLTTKAPIAKHSQNPSPANLL